MYKVIYRIGYQDSHDNNCHVDILRRDYTGNITELEAAPDPFIINFSGREKYTPIIGQGATINFIVDGDFSLRSLYSNDMLEHKVKAYRESHCWWEGYINTEVYTESLNACVSELNITANDGLALLTRMPFKDAGFLSPWNVIKNIINKLRLDLNNIYLSINQYEKRMNSLSSPLHQLFVDLTNYYDEQGDAMSSREVLEEILRPFGASLFIQDSNLIIIDNEELKKDVIEFKIYNSEFNYITNKSIDNTIDIESVDWFNQPSLDIIAGYNKKIIRYSPYPVQDMFSEVDFSNQDLWIGTPVWTEDQETREYWLNGISGILGFELFEGCKFIGHKESNIDQGDFYIQVPTNVDGIFFRRNEADRLLCSTENDIGIVLSIPFQLLKKGDSSDITKVTFKIRAKVGDMYLSGNNSSLGGNSWSTDSESIFEFSLADLSGITSSWKDIECIIHSGFEPGKLSYELIGRVIVYNHKFIYGDGPNNTRIKMAIFSERDFSDIECIQLNPPRTELKQLRKVKARSQTIGAATRYYYEVVNDEDNDSVSSLINDIEYVGEMDEEWINAGDDVELKHGDSIKGNFTDRGAFHMADTLEYTSQWKRPTESDYYKLPELLLQSCVSNFSKNMDSINGNLTHDNMFNGNAINFKNILTFLSVIKYQGKRFMCLQGDYHDRDATMDCNYIEIGKDQLIIEKL